MVRHAREQVNDERTSVAFAARELIRRSRTAALATTLAGPGGHPYASMVTVASDMDASPIMLFSDLSDHTRNLAMDGRASLLFEAASRRRNPQTGPRVTLCGNITKIGDTRLCERFLAHHPDAKLYADFRDFTFYRMTVDRAHWVGGFAQARWIAAEHLMFGDAEAVATIIDTERHVLDHMNADHGEALDACAHAFEGRRGNGWRMVGLDPEGMDIQCGTRFARIGFDHPVRNAQECRQALVHMAKRAKSHLTG